MLNDDEKKTLQTWIENNPECKDQLADIQRLAPRLTLIHKYKSINANKAWMDIKKKIGKSADIEFFQTLTFSWKKIAAVIIPFFIAGASIYFLIHNHRLEPSEDIYNSYIENVKPITAEALLELGNGEKITLQGKGKDTVTNKNGISIGLNISNTLSYENDISQKEEYNILSTPIGGEYNLILSDGTKVYLNSGSQLRFPNKFISKNKREVELIGEAYFEVKKDKTRPFHVNTPQSTIKVLGTEFNVCCYKEDYFEQTTLTKGLVEILNENSIYTLTPGKQLESYSNQSIVSVRDVEVLLYTSWKEGLFRFNNIPLSELTVKLERWYNVKFQFKDSYCENLRFTGAIKKDADFKQFINLIGSTTNVEFSIQGNEIIISRE